MEKCELIGKYQQILGEAECGDSIAKESQKYFYTFLSLIIVGLFTNFSALFVYYSRAAKIIMTAFYFF